MILIDPNLLIVQLVFIYEFFLYSLIYFGIKPRYTFFAIVILFYDVSRSLKILIVSSIATLICIMFDLGIISNVATKDLLYKLAKRFGI
jgi:hypothetical protein